jgi:hypothetical protein
VAWRELGAGRVQVEFGRHEGASENADEEDPGEDDGAGTEDQTTTARGGRQ